ncbi:MAG: DCC1-like thiol-disulfide oxidoreductase family protein [Methylococcales bacterium]|nr:DCC1-like thiol-disulfide oxidoreductase family protein [Methylococcales bacterium]
MYRFFYRHFLALARQPAPSFPIGLFRALFGLITLQEVGFLIYFQHLIFDPVPYLDVEFPMLPFFLTAWAIVALAIVLGYRCQQALIANYLFWVVFVQLTPMQRDFDGGFDLYMIGVNFLLLFMPVDKAFAVDRLRLRWHRPLHLDPEQEPVNVSRLAYYLPVLIGLGFLYFDSGLHKLSAPHWRNGLGAWLPATQPYYISALDFSWLLNQAGLQKVLGYSIIVFQLSFPFFFHWRWLRPWYLLFGLGLHSGITLMLNIYPFGLGMLIFYCLLVPFSWWRYLGQSITLAQHRLTVYYDRDCALCNRTVQFIRHFDSRGGVCFLNAQDHADQQPRLSHFSESELLRDLYAVDAQGQVYAGLDTYIQILRTLGYTLPLALLLRMPGLYTLASLAYRRIADRRMRKPCGVECPLSPAKTSSITGYDRLITARPDHLSRSVNKVTRVFVLLLLFQINSTLHYGLLYRSDDTSSQHPVVQSVAQASNTIILFSQMFFGITPHALYMHDHFQGYDTLLALAYLDDQGHEQWLPFVDQTGRLLAPHWGRVHSMWANVAVTPKIDRLRLKKAVMKITAFWTQRLGRSLDKADFIILAKPNCAPSKWRKSLRAENLKGSWRRIGMAVWLDGEMRLEVDLPDFSKTTCRYEKN